MDALAGTRVLTTPAARSVTETFDPATLLTQTVTTPDLAPASFAYDARGRLVSRSFGTRTASRAYDAAGNVASVTDPLGRTTSFEHDPLGRTTAIHRPDGKSIAFVHDHNGNMTVLTTPSSVAHVFAYNGVGRESAYDTPLSGAYSYVYDRDRRLTQIVFPSGKTVENVYADARLTAIRSPEGETSLTYDACGSKVVGASRGAEAIAYGHDGALVTSETLSGTLNQTLTFGHDADFRLSGLGYAGGTEALAYDPDGLLIGSGAYAVARDAESGLPVAVTGHDLAVARNFNEYAEVAATTTSVAGSDVAAFGFERDAAGRVARRLSTVAGASREEVYAYDDLGRLTSVTRDGVAIESYVYTGPHNARSAETNHLRGVVAREYVYDAEDRLVSAGSTTFAYDVDGFLTSKTVGGAETRYAYGARGELLRVDLPGGDVIAYAHDPLGRRIAKTVNGATVERYLWQGRTRLLAIFDSTGALKWRFEYADARTPVAATSGADGARYYLASDQVGTLRAVADATGTVVKTTEYDSFGNLLTDTNPSLDIPFGFAGGLYDKATGLTRFGFRDYDVDTGRWTAKDPIGFDGGDTDLYGYVVNDPVTWFDPDGLEYLDINFAFGAGAGLLFGAMITDSSVYLYSGVQFGVEGFSYSITTSTYDVSTGLNYAFQHTTINFNTAQAGIDAFNNFFFEVGSAFPPGPSFSMYHVCDFPIKYNNKDNNNQHNNNNNDNDNDNDNCSE